MLFPFSARQSKPQTDRSRSLKLLVEQLEERSVPATFVVSNLADAGTGSLRQALLNANSIAGNDTIRFSVAGSIQLASALPAVTDTVTLAGNTAPGFNSAPVVGIDFNGFTGLRFNGASGGSVVQSLGMADATGAGLTLNAGQISVFGSYIGLQLNGVNAGSNSGDGIVINATSSGNTIGAAIGSPNVISGNGGNGILINGSSGNIVRANFIGTDVTGLKQRSNQGNGIHIAGGASNNFIGGRIPANPPGTDPNELSGKRPPEGNLISGNAGNGVLINAGSTANTLSGNFIGTDASGIKAQGNLQNGVSIMNANGNSLLGTQVNLNPFIYYNVVSGNAGNGLQVMNSNNTVIQANFFGLGSDDNAAVGNGGNGVVIGGSSRNTTLGGIIPLGNVIAANAGHGVVVQDQASGFVSENSFVGVAAFNLDTTLGNKKDGFHITSTGGNNIARINVISSNKDDGVEISGNARGVQFVQNIIGLNTDGASAMPNSDNGIEVGGTAHDLVLGGLVGGFSIIPASTISANGGFGVAFVGQSHNVSLNFARIGTDSQGLALSSGPQTLGNVKGGVYIGPGAGSITIGSPDRNLETIIAGNKGNGILINGSQNNVVEGTYIGLDKDGNSMPNVRDGIRINNASHNFIGGGGSGQTNVVSANGGNGITITGSGSTDNQIRGNFVGTDPTGLIARGNIGNGIQVASGAEFNTLGGEVSGNPPDTAPDKFSGARPPSGNLVSGNLGNGILINGASPNNALYGNFVGTDATGIAPLGNALDGVSIVNANNTVLAGTLPTQDPFVYYNVVSGNTGNGLRVKDSDGTIVQANFFGLGSDDMTPVGNLQNGVVFEGTSRNTTFGGPIPLGNVIAGNNGHGVVLQDTVGNFLASNNFTGVVAFNENVTDAGNGQDGWHITATGGNIVLKVGNIISENGDDGIEVSGNASGVQIVQDIIGLNTDGKVARPNVDNGIEIGGTAHNIVIGGQQTDFSVVPTGTVSGNGGYGIALLGAAHDNQINFVHVGTNSGGIAEPGGPQALGNQLGGIYVGPGTRNTTIGSRNPNFPTTISGNVGSGITIDGSSGNVVVNTIIGLSRDGTAMPNTGDGVTVISGQRNRITQNSISANGVLGIDLQSGANNGQASPVITTAVLSGTNIVITGTLTSTPSTTFTLEVFADTVTPGGSAQGQYYLGNANVSTNAAGVATFTITVPVPPAGATDLTATATDPNGNTSEFSLGFALPI